MPKYLYYPGCSMDSSASAYHDSLTRICEPLGIDLEEVRDWNCCGATEYLAVSRTPAYALIGRNLALAAEQANGCQTVMAPCSACYLNLTKADHYMVEDPELRENVNSALGAGGLHYEPGTLQFRHLLDVLVNEVGLEEIERHVVRPLTGLRVAPYVGCMVPRPDLNHRFSSHEQPDELDRLLRALGAEVIDYPLKTHCCGGHMTQIGPETAYELIRRLIQAADQYDADIMATLCPMCQMNLDAYQGEMNKHFGTDYQVPIVFFTQLIGLAFGNEAKSVGFGKEFVGTRKALSKVGVAAPTGGETPKKKAPKKKGDNSLPMPQPNGEEVL